MNKIDENHKNSIKALSDSEDKLLKVDDFSFRTKENLKNNLNESIIKINSSKEVLNDYSSDEEEISDDCFSINNNYESEDDYLKDEEMHLFSRKNKNLTKSEKIKDYENYLENDENEFEQDNLYFQSSYSSKQEYEEIKKSFIERNKDKDFFSSKKIPKNPVRGSQGALNCSLENDEISYSNGNTENFKHNAIIAEENYSKKSYSENLINTNLELDQNNNQSSNNTLKYSQNLLTTSSPVKFQNFISSCSSPPQLISTISNTDQLIRPIYSKRPFSYKQHNKSNGNSNNNTGLGSIKEINDSYNSIEYNTSKFFYSNDNKIAIDLTKINNQNSLNNSIDKLNNLKKNSFNQDDIHKSPMKMSEKNNKNSISTVKKDLQEKSLDNKFVIHNKIDSFNPLLKEKVNLNLELEQLKQHHELQRQMMLKKFKQEERQLVQIHEKKLQERIRTHIQVQEFSPSKSAFEEIKKEPEPFKAKEKEETSTIASSLVRKRLKELVINKLKREQGGYPNKNSPGVSSPVNWNTGLKFNDDLIPLRKTASEPNLKVKSALKQKVMYRRCSPLLKRKTKRLGKGPIHLNQINIGEINAHSAPVSASSSMESSTPPNSKPDSIPGSPTTYVGSSITTGNSASSTPKYNEPLSSQTTGSPSNDIQLYSSPSLPNISVARPHFPVNELQRRFYPFGPSTSPTLLHHQKLKQHLKHKLEKETMSSSAVGSISLNQSFINTATAASFRKTHGVAPLLVSNSVDSPLTRDSSPPTMNHSFQTHSDQQFNSNQNFSTGMPINPTVASIRSLRKPLNRTQSAPLSFGYPILPNVVNATNQGNNSPQAKQSPNNSSIITKNNLPNGPIDTEFVKQRVRQTVLTRSANRQQKQPLLQNKFKQQKHHSFSLDEEPSDEKNKSFDKNVDSGSGSFDECYIENMPKSEYDLKLENEALLQFQQQQLIQNLQQGIGSFNYEAQLSQLSPSEQLLYQQLILQQQQQLLLLFQQQQANSNIYSKNHDQVPINDLPGLSSLNISDEMSNNYNQYTQAFLDRFNLSNNLLKRASSTPVVQLVSPLINQNKVSYSSLVGTFSHLNLSQNNLSMISSTSNPGSPDPIDQNSTAIVTDESMLRHDCTCGNPNNHLENPTRLLAIFKRLFITGLSSKCCYLPARKATIEELESVHGSTYCQLFAVDSQSRQKLDASQIDKLPIKSYVKMNCGGVGVDSDTVWNESLTASAVRFAAGCVIDLAILVAKNKLKNGFAIVRPPGHHAEYQQPMGFCYFNSVAVAAQQLKLKLGLKRILILDWDVHHGNGTQKQFYDDDKVLYMSLHRHDQGNFFPGTGDVTECGIAGSSLGKTINIAWYGSVNLYGDAEYLAAFRSIVLPVIQEWKPEMVLVSCGFDAAEGHLPQLGGYHLSPAMFGWMTNEVLKLTNGKIVLALEGGYELSSICSSTEQVVKALLNLPLESISETELSRRPNLMAVETLTKVYKIQSPYWNCLKSNLVYMNCSHIDATNHLNSITNNPDEDLDIEVDDNHMEEVD